MLVVVCSSMYIQLLKYLGLTFLLSCFLFIYLFIQFLLPHQHLQVNLSSITRVDLNEKRGSLTLSITLEKWEFMTCIVTYSVLTSIIVSFVARCGFNCVIIITRNWCKIYFMITHIMYDIHCFTPPLKNSGSRDFYSAPQRDFVLGTTYFPNWSILYLHCLHNRFQYATASWTQIFQTH